MRRTSGESALGTPGVRSGTSGDQSHDRMLRSGLPFTLEMAHCRWTRCRGGPMTSETSPTLPPMDARRALPSVESVVRALDGLPHSLLVDCAREAVDDARARVARDESV